MKVRRVGVETHVRLDLDAVAARPEKPTHQTSADMVSALPEEVVEEILLRVPPDEPAHLVRAALVCKAWRSVLSDVTFRRRYRRFHRTPPLQGYICNQHTDSTVRFVPTTSVANAASLAFAPMLDDDISGRLMLSSALDCRHGRVLIHSEAVRGRVERLTVWDPVTGTQQHLSYPYPRPYECVGAVLCAKDDDGCNHLDCHGGPFLVVLVGFSRDHDDVHTWASKYSSETGAWSAPTTPNAKTNRRYDMTPSSLLIGDALHFATESGGYNIIKYDLRKHELSVMELPGVFDPILIKGDDGGLGLATMSHSCIYIWSWQVDNNGVGGSMKYKVTKLDGTLLPEGPRYLICMAEGTYTVFVRVRNAGVFTLDLKSRQVRKIGDAETYYDHRPILPYTSFYTPKY